MYILIIVGALGAFSTVGNFETEKLCKEASEKVLNIQDPELRKLSQLTYLCLKTK